MFPWVMFAVQARGMGWQYSFCVPIALFAAGLLFPVYMSVVPAAKAQVDSLGERNRGLRGNEEEVNGDHADGPQTPIQRLSRAFTVVMAKLKDSHERESGDGDGDGTLPTVEHRERRSWGS